MRKKRILTGLFTVLIVLTPIVAYSRRLSMYDAWRLYGYQVPGDISSLADDTTMVDSARRLFYVYHPLIENKDDFNKNCRDDEQTIVLGCYVNGKGIYIFNVTDSRLSGIEQVTAAHEMLHAAYERLSETERKSVDSMTAMAFAGLDNQEIADRIALYRNQDPSIVPNELHSILGTEQRVLPADLEQYYKRYFTDRTKIVDYAAAYDEAFTSRKSQIADYDAQLSNLKKQIDSLKSLLTKQSAELTKKRQQMTELKNNDQINEFNAAVPGFNNTVDTYNGNVTRLGNIIDQYNTVVSARNNLATEEQTLVHAIDSRTAVPQMQ